MALEAQTPQSPQPAAPPAAARVRVFIDYWNFQLTMNERVAAGLGVADHRFTIDWRRVGPWLAKKACEAIGVSPYSFDGVIIYTSYNPSTSEGNKYHGWVTNWLDRQPGVSVVCRERKPRALPKCPSCYRVIEYCPHAGCGKKIVSTVEKGVDTYIATDMIRLAWENAYDLAVLATSDSDLVPAVDFLNVKARKIVQAGFPPKGIDLATSCWASFDVYADRAEIERR
jgi:uncharacterized LabA/DUF88 family protein